MTLLWILYLVAVPTLIGVALLVLERAARSAGLATRFLWMAGLSLALVFPAAVALTAPEAASSPGSAVRMPAVLVGAGEAAEATVSRGLRVAPRTVGVFAMSAWAIAAAFALARMLVGAVLLRRERAGWVRERLDGTPVLVSPGRGPAVLGVLHPEIVVPSWLRTLGAADRALVLRHESEHVRARDALLHVAGLVMLGLAPWNPAIRWLFGRLTLAIETDCDARVLRGGASRSRYEHLLTAIAGRSTAVGLAPALAERPSHLERRIVAMRAHRSRRSPLHSIVAAAAGAALIAVACTAPTPATADSAAATGSAPAKDERPDQPLSEFQVDAPVTPRTMTPPVYPAELRRRGVEGELIVQFVVDTGGRVQMDTFEAVRSPDAAFTDAVRTALATAEFEPAVAGGRAVRQLVQMPFVFALSR